MTTIGIGSGHVGSNIAKAAITNDYDVVLSNSQGPDSLTGLVQALGAHASAATPATNGAAAEVPLVTAADVGPACHAERMSAPGANRSTQGP